MLSEYKENKLIEIFVQTDDFCQELDSWLRSQGKYKPHVKKMKNKLIHLSDRYYLFKRGVIESVNDILMTVCDIEHTRHRSPVNCFTHIMGALVAYGFLDQKPSVVTKPPELVKPHII